MAAHMTRRRFLTEGAGLAACLVGSIGNSSLADPAKSPNSSGAVRSEGGELVDTSVRALAAAIRAKKLSSFELVQAYLDRIEEVNPWLNAVVNLTAESALTEARKADTMLMQGKITGPLHGVPMTLKDSLNTAGVVTTWSVPGRSGYLPSRDATVVARLKGAGAILLGKTNTPELTLSFETNSPLFGPTNNPYDVDRTAGGSSGGAAAIVAASGSAFDIGSDTGGSVRVPSHCCGVAGIRPTSGRVPRTGNAIGPGGLLDSLTSIGPIARYVEDLSLILSVISGPDPCDPATVPMPIELSTRTSVKTLRGTFHTDNGISAPDQETVAAVVKAVRVLERAGMQFEELRPPGIGETMEVFMDLMNWDGGAWRNHLLKQAGSEAAERQAARGKQNLSAEHLIGMIDRWDRYRARMLGFLAPYDLLICPANARPAMRHGSSQDNLDAFSHTIAYSLTDWPAAVVRAATSPQGLPIGIQCVAQPWREDIALAAARQIESEIGGWQSPSI